MAVTRRTWLAAMACVFVAAVAHGQSPPVTPVKLALRGYDPVAYFTDGKPTPGSSAFSYVWDASRYQFVSAAHRDLFAANPSKYAPQYSGSCAASMASGLKYEGNPENWTIANGRLFLFAGPQGPEKFHNNPDLVATADQNWQKLSIPASK